VSGELRFDGKVAIVTGAGRGLGRAHAHLLAARGATVVVNDLGCEVRGGGSSPEPANEVAAEIEATGVRAVADHSDVTSYAATAHLVEQTVDRFGSLDVVISNAGLSHAVPFEEMAPEVFDVMVKTQVYGTFNVMRCAWPHLGASGHGRAVLTTGNSIFGGPNAQFSAGNGGVIALMRSLAVQGRRHGIGVNAVASGGVTRMAHNRTVEMESLVPPEWCSPAYAWLAHESCEVTGEVIAAAGGYVKRIFIAQTRGWGAPGHAPEDVRDHWAEIVAEDGYEVPPDTVTDSEQWMRIFQEMASS
jgi:NAD(P)-dependent dehydrogenase (short-subunit alcohol dehydrogenase family)